MKQKILKNIVLCFLTFVFMSQVNAWDDFGLNEPGSPLEGEWIFDLSGIDKGGVILNFLSDHSFDGYGLTLEFGPFKVSGNYEINAKGLIHGSYTIREWETEEHLGTGNFSGKVNKKRTQLALKTEEGLNLIGVILSEDPGIPENWTVKIKGMLKGTFDQFKIEPLQIEGQILKKAFLISGSGDIQNIGTAKIDGGFILTQKNMGYGIFEFKIEGITAFKGTFSGKITLPSGKFNWKFISEDRIRFVLTGMVNP